MESFAPSQPESYSQLIWRSLALYRASFSKVLLLSVLLGIVAFIPRLMADAIGQDIFANLEPFSPNRLWLVAVDIASLIFFIAILWHVHCVIRGKHEPFIEDFSVGAKKAFYVFIAALFQSAIIFAFGLIVYGLLIVLHHLDLLFVKSLAGVILTSIIFFAQFILLLYVSTLFVFIIPLIAIENKGIFRALENSVLLVWNHCWRAFSTQMTPWICYIILLILLKYVLNIDVHIYFTHKAHYEIWTTILNIVIFVLFAPWVASLLLVQLKDLELRKHLAPKHRSKKK